MTNKTSSIKEENFKRYKDKLVYVIKYDSTKTMFWLVYEQQGRVFQTSKGLDLFTELTDEEHEMILSLSDIESITDVLDEDLIQDLEGDFDLLEMTDEASCIAQVNDIQAQAYSFTNAYNTQIAKVNKTDANANPEVKNDL